MTHLRQLYAMAQPGFSGRPTVPALWDERERTIVNNESAALVRQLGSEFNAVAKHPALDLYPAALRPEIERWNTFIQDAVNKGVYRAGFATHPADHEAAVTQLFSAFDRLEAHLAKRRFLAGATPTEADWRLLPTLLRFEWVYHDLFRCNRRRLADYPQLLAYTRDLFQWPGIAATANEALTREGYFTSMKRLNPSGLVPARATLDFMAPHGRG